MLKLFSVYDSQTESFIQPFYSLTTASAIRSFTQAANDADHQFKQFGADFTLFELGEFDQSTAKFTLLPTPKSLGLALQFITPSRTDELMSAHNYPHTARGEASAEGGKGDASPPTGPNHHLKTIHSNPPQSAR